MDLSAAGFGGSLTDVVPELRTMAESLMTLTLRAYAPGGSTTDADEYEVPGYTDKGLVAGKMQSPSSQGGNTPTRYFRVGEVERPVLEGGLHIPLDAEVPVPGRQRGLGWEYEVVDAYDPADPALIGRRFLVVEVPAKSFATARRLDVVEVTE